MSPSSPRRAKAEKARAKEKARTTQADLSSDQRGEAKAVEEKARHTTRMNGRAKTSPTGQVVVGAEEEAEAKAEARKANPKEENPCHPARVT